MAKQPLSSTFLLALALSSSAGATTPYSKLEEKHTCRFEQAGTEARFMQSFLKEKNAIDLLEDRSRETNSRKTRLSDAVIAPSYKKKHNLPSGKIELDVAGSEPERLICIRAAATSGAGSATTILTNSARGWSRVTEYTLTNESGRWYISPPGSPQAKRPFPPHLSALALPNDPTYYVRPGTEVDRFSGPIPVDLSETDEQKANASMLALANLRKMGEDCMLAIPIIKKDDGARIICNNFEQHMKVQYYSASKELIRQLEGGIAPQNRQAEFMKAAGDMKESISAYERLRAAME